MTGMVQPDLGPPATKYKEDSIDDPVSIISIGTFSFFLSSSRLPYRFSVRSFPLQYHSYLSWSFICGCQLYVQWDYHFSRLVSLLSTWILWEQHGQYPTRQSPTQNADIDRFGVCWS